MLINQVRGRTKLGPTALNRCVCDVTPFLKGDTGLAKRCVVCGSERRAAIGNAVPSRLQALGGREESYG